MFEDGFAVGVDRTNNLHNRVTFTRVVLWEAIGDGPEEEARVSREASLNVGVKKKTMVDGGRVEESDVEALEC